MIKFRALMIALAVLFVMVWVLIAKNHTSEVQAMPIEEYIRFNISDLSTTANAPEVLGGTFYITQIQAQNGSGTVSYEDGHNGYTADFTYTTDEKGFITIKSFTVK